jgi:hypothetical protein
MGARTIGRVEEQPSRKSEVVLAKHRFVREEFRRQVRQPRGGLMAALIEAEEAGHRLSEDELVAMVFLLLAAGHETTLHQIACSVLTLLDRPERRAELLADWSLIDSAVQELLRYVSFAQVTKPRYAGEDTEFRGREIRRGQMVFGCLAAANSDPTVFESPNRLDSRRHPNRHLAFGAAIHFCLGPGWPPSRPPSPFNASSHVSPRSTSPFPALGFDFRLALALAPSSGCQSSGRRCLVHRPHVHRRYSAAERTGAQVLQHPSVSGR